MQRTINTINDARDLISDWTERYDAQPTSAQIDRAARALVAHIGGYGNVAGGESTEDFDLDAALYDAV